ncbi:MAG: phosphonate C-P lyase system protein PhnG [Alphaproteobacteria bacterium]
MLPAQPHTQDPAAARRRWLSVLAKATRGEVEEGVANLPAVPAYHFLRRPEAGLVMVRGRIGGTGGPFNLGEMTVTRCAVQLDGGGAPGIGYVAGRDSRHAELVALLDALLQRRNGLDLDSIVDRLEAAQTARRQRAQADVAATKVDFFTMVRE